MNYDEQNIFAKIIRGELPAEKIYEDEKVNKDFQYHILIQLLMNHLF